VIRDGGQLPPGILPFQALADARNDGWFASEGFRDEQLQPASIDLRLGATAYRLRCSFLPDRGSTVDQKLSAFALDEVDLTEGAILERNRPYLIPLKEELALPDHVRGKANPKSSAGRVDIFTRVLTDNNARFDEIGPGYHGRLYLEVVPRSFMVKAREDLSLNQLRLMAGDHGSARVSDSELLERQMDAKAALLFLDGTPIAAHDLALAEGLFLSLDLQGNAEGYVGFRARRNSRFLDLSAVGKYSWEDFWEPVKPESGARLVLEPEEFYLLLSRESVAVPPDLAAEMAAYDPSAGEFRTHYAGFFDPGFGSGHVAGAAGSRATLEIRARDVPFMIEHGQPVCRLVFETLLAETELLYGKDIGSSYQGQQVTLSKHFTAQGPTGQLVLPDAARTPALAS
jgi:dCTP deaminase